MTRKGRTLLVALLACGCFLDTALAWAGETLAVHASFSPNELGAPANLSLTARLASSTAGPPSPISRFTLYAPAGMEVDVRGAGACTQTTLEQSGPSGCPADSRAGFGGGVGLIELPTEIIHTPYTLDFFFAPSAGGRLRLLVYASVLAPAAVQFVIVAKQISAPEPYGFGFSVEVPPIATFPGAPDASVESVFATFGGSNIAYYKTVHGKRTLVRLRGMVVPKRCPSGGFQSKGTVGFADGTTLSINPTIPCPRH